MYLSHSPLLFQRNINQNNIDLNVPSALNGAKSSNIVVHLPLIQQAIMFYVGEDSQKVWTCAHFNSIEN